MFRVECFECHSTYAIKVSLSVGNDEFIIQCGVCENSLRQSISFSDRNGVLQVYEKGKIHG